MKQLKSTFFEGGSPKAWDDLIEDVTTYKTQGVKFLKLHSGKVGSKPALPDLSGILNDDYPLVKKLYSAGEPEAGLKVFVDWLNSKEARKVIREEGFTAP